MSVRAVTLIAPCFLPGLGDLASLHPWVYGLRGSILSPLLLPYFVQNLVVVPLVLIDLEAARIAKSCLLPVWPLRFLPGHLSTAPQATGDFISQYCLLQRQNIY